MLKIEGLTKTFGGIKAVAQCSFEVKKGTITALIGPNGAGKTTVFNLITGFYSPNVGHVYFKGEDITSLAPHQVFHRGLFRTFQIVRAHRDMTVLESLLLMPKAQLGENIWNVWLRSSAIENQEKENIHRALEILEFLEMESKQDMLVTNLPGGEKKLLDLGRMMMAEPEIVLLDEPGAGVPPTMQKKVNSYINRLCLDEEITFLVVEHDMNVIMNLCNPIIVMADGRKLSEGTPEQIQSDKQVIKAYLGEETDLNDTKLEVSNNEHAKS